MNPPEFDKTQRQTLDLTHLDPSKHRTGKVMEFGRKVRKDKQNLSPPGGSSTAANLLKKHLWDQENQEITQVQASSKRQEPGL